MSNFFFTSTGDVLVRGIFLPIIAAVTVIILIGAAQKRKGENSPAGKCATTIELWRGQSIVFNAINIITGLALAAVGIFMIVAGHDAVLAIMGALLNFFAVVGTYLSPNVWASLS